MLIITQDSIPIAGLKCWFDWLGSKFEGVHNEGSIVGEGVAGKFNDG
jgi:hypothetical protein